MKIVYSILGTYNSGGMERVLSNKANYLAKLGYTVFIITTDQKGRDSYFPIDKSIECIDLGINYTNDYGKGLLQKSINYIKKQNQHYKSLESVLLRLKPDIVVSMFDNDADILHNIKDGSKKIIEIHFSRFKRLQYNRKGLLKFIDRYRSKQDLKIVKKYDCFVVLTEEDKGYWKGVDRIEVIPNANSFVTSDYALLEKKQVIAVGRFDYQKGFEDLINAWSYVYEHNPDWRLNIYGNGPLKNELARLIDRLSLNDVVFLKEPTKEIQKVYLDHSIIAMTSRYEGLPMVLLEAQASGLPIVSYSCKCGPRDIIKNNGFLVEEGNIKEMAQSLLILMNNIDLRKQMGKYSVENSKKFSEELVMNKWITLFNNLLNK